MNMITRLTGPQLFAAAALFTLTLAMLLAPSSLFAQASQYYHSRGIVLDDGAGHSVILLPPTTGSGGGTITLPPSGLVWPTTNVAGVLTNDGSGGLTWGVGGGGSFLPLAGGSITGTVGIGVAQNPGTGLTITEPPGIAPSGLGGMVINNTDVVGGSLPLVINQNTTGLTWSESVGGTEGRMLRLYDGSQIYDFGITQTHGFFLGNGLGITGQIISATSAGNVTIPRGGLTSAADMSANGVIIGSQGGSQSTRVGNGSVSNYNNSTSIGFFASNGTTGADNTAVGTNSLRNAGSPTNTVAIGESAGAGGGGITGGVGNTFVGNNTMNTVTGVTNATAIGYQATVATSNALVLGAINTVNGATSSTKVGIGTASPVAMLSVGTSSALQVDASGNLSTTGTSTLASSTVSTSTAPIALTVTSTTAAPTTVLSMNGGRVVMQSTASTPPSGATIAANVAAVVVGDNGTTNSPATITLPAGTEGQILYITTQDPDGVTITTTVNSVVVNVTIDDTEVGTFMYLGGQWRLQH